MIAQRKYQCDACHQSLKKVPLAPMLHDHIWNQLASRHERMLCATCVFERADRLLDHRLSLEDLRPCSFNLVPGPCWFDFFRSDGHHDPKVFDEWRAVGAEI